VTEIIDSFQPTKNIVYRIKIILKPKQCSVGMVDKIVLTRPRVISLRYLQEKLYVIIYDVH